MTFSYQVVTKEQADKMRYNLLEKGEYEFVVYDAKQKPSTSGNPMIELWLTVWDKEGCKHTIKDFLVSTEKMQWKIRNFCEAVGLMKEYENNTFDDQMCVHKRGKAIIRIKKGDPKDDGSVYPDKNVVDDYLIMDNAIATKKESDEFINDAIPF